MNNEHDRIDFIILLDYACTSKDYKCNFNTNYEEYPLKKYVLVLQKCNQSHMSAFFSKAAFNERRLPEHSPYLK